MKNALLSLVLLASTTLMYCSKTKTEVAPCSGGATEYQLDVPFSMCYGTVVHGMDDNVTLDVAFDEVYGDSRCANDVICVWQGRVDVGLTLTHGQTQLKDTLAIGGLGGDPVSDSTLFQGYKIKLIAVDPYPQMASVPIPTEEYKLKLVISHE